MQHLYIQYHRYIDAKRTGWKRSNRTCLKLHCLLWIRTSNVIILNITCSRSQHYLLSGQSFFFQVSVFPERPVHRCYSWNFQSYDCFRYLSAGMPMNRAFGENWRTWKSIFRLNSGYRMILHLIHNPKEKKQFCQQVLLYSFYQKKLGNVLLELSWYIIMVTEI